MAESEWDTPESMERTGTFLKEPGRYHFTVVEVDEEPKNCDFGAFKVHAEVCEGEEKGKQGTLTFFPPKLTQKNNGEFAKKRRALFAEAVGILPKAAPGEKVKVNLQDALYRQFVAEMDYDAKDTEKKYLDMAFCEVYHVDDPKVAKVPKSKGHLDLLPTEQRRKPESFAKPGSKPAGHSANGSGSTATKPAANTPPASAVDVSDL